MYAITAASGQLGRLVVDALLETVPASDIIAIVRDPRKLAEVAARGVEVREGDYDRPETMRTAMEGVTRLLLISSNEMGRRLEQHMSAIEAAKQAGVSLIAYTSMLHADTSPAKLAQEHRATELAILASGLPYVLLRNGWYNENFLIPLPAVLEHGALVGAAGEGRFSPAAREDFARAAAIVLTSEDQKDRVYELAGDAAITMTDVAAEIAREAGKPVVYHRIPQEELKHVFLSAGLPEVVADALADEDAVAADDTLFNADGELSRLIGRPTIPFGKTVAETFAAGS